MQIAIFPRFSQPLRQPSPRSNQRFMAHFERGNTHRLTRSQQAMLGERFPDHVQDSRLLGVDEGEF